MVGGGPPTAQGPVSRRRGDASGDLGIVPFVAAHAHPGWPSIQVSALALVPSASGNPPTMSVCHNSIGAPRSQRFHLRERRSRTLGSIIPQPSRVFGQQLGQPRAPVAGRPAARPARRPCRHSTKPPVTTQRAACRGVTLKSLVAQGDFILRCTANHVVPQGNSSGQSREGGRTRFVTEVFPTAAQW
jgi:hypothetical protein